MMRPWLMTGIAGMLMVLGSFLPVNARPEPSKPAFDSGQALGLTQAELGHRLFVAKGCAGCHQHDAIANDMGIQMGPDLSRITLDPAFLREWLENPAAVRPGTEMPALGLDDAEIEALIAFLTTPPPESP